MPHKLTLLKWADDNIREAYFYAAKMFSSTHFANDLKERGKDLGSFFKRYLFSPWSPCNVSGQKLLA